MTELTKNLLSITPEQKEKGIWISENDVIFNELNLCVTLFHEDSDYSTPRNFTGVFKRWYPNGQPREVSNWKNGKRHGETKIWYVGERTLGTSDWENGEHMGEVLTKC